MDFGEQQLAKVLSLVLLVVMVAATLQLIWQVGWALTVPSTPWMGSKLNQVLGDLLTLMIALEVLQNITSYLRRHVVLHRGGRCRLDAEKGVYVIVIQSEPAFE